MSFYDAIRVGASGAADFEVERSLRFNNYSSSADDAALTRTVSSTGNRKTFTHSFWVKRTKLGYGMIYGHTDTSGSYFFSFVFNSDDKIEFNEYRYNESPSNKCRLITTRVFRDPSAWYHIVAAVDTTQSTASDRVKIYVNGVQETSFGTEIYFDQNHDTYFNSTSPYPIMRIGLNGWGYGGANCYLAEFNAIDGLQLTPSSFAETNVVTGQWIAKKYAGSYGTNGFRLTFADNSGTTATTLGKDESGNSNNFTPNNFSVAAGVGNDSVSDTPTNNFCTFNPLKVNASKPIVFSEGNLQHNGVSGDNHLRSASTMQVNSGKWYVEFKFISGYEATNSTVSFGLTTDAANNRASNNDAMWYQNTDNFVAIMYRNNGTVQSFLEASSQSTLSGLPTFVNGDVMGIALDLDNDKFFVSKNGTFFSNGTGTQDPAAGTNPLYSGGYLTSRKSDGFYFGVDGYSAQVVTADFGQHGYAYTPPSGFKKVNSENLPDPTILLPNKHFDTLLWSGNGTANRAITGLNFQPDWVWLKSRTNTDYHQRHDSNRGASAGALFHVSAAEDPNYPLDSFDSNGFTTSEASDQQNTSGQNYVAWNWNAGNTDGKTYTVTVVSDSGNKYRFDGFGTSAVTLDLAEGGTYIFNYPSAHPFRFSTTSDGTHGGGSEYTTGVTHNSSTQVTIVVPASAPTLYYYCSIHSGMGGQVNTNSTLGSSNFDGNLQSVTKVNATAGFSIVKWTSGGNLYKTVGHGLGVKPDIVILKSRTTSNNWFVYFDVIDGTNDFMELSATNAALDAETYSIVPPTSTVFGTDGAFVSGSTNIPHIAYVFSSVAGYSKIGTYTGNGSTDGTFVFTGFRPAWVLVKRTDSAENWVLKDSARNTFNNVFSNLNPNTSNAEFGSSGDVNSFDFVSNGFKIRGSNSAVNASSGTFIYLAFSESPFKNARAR